MNELDELIEATKQGNLERIRAILGADDKLADQREESGATPLHYAALNGHRRAGEDIAGLGVKTTMAAPLGVGHDRETEHARNVGGRSP